MFAEAPLTSSSPGAAQCLSIEFSDGSCRKHATPERP
jgi:hypothetical protein